jgi:zinc transport system permease protein
MPPDELIVDAPPAWADFVAAWDLYRDPVLCAAIAGAVLGLLGVYVVLRRMVFVSAAVTQAAGLGVALSFYSAIHWGFGFDPIYGAAGMSLVTTLVLLYDPQARLGVTRESLLGFAYAVTGGAAIVVGAKIAQEANDISAILFGTAVLVRPADLAAVTWIGAALLVVHVWWFRGLTFATLDPGAARVQRLPVGLLSAVILLSIGLMVGVSARAVGALPVLAFSTMPATAALVASRRHLRLTFALAALGGALAGGGGYVIAFLRDWPVGATQTVTAAALVPVALVWRAALRLAERLSRR